MRWGKTAELLVQLDKIGVKELKALLREVSATRAQEIQKTCIVNSV